MSVLQNIEAANFIEVVEIINILKIGTPLANIYNKAF
jgi:hypothetical protein